MLSTWSGRARQPAAGTGSPRATAAAGAGRGWRRSIARALVAAVAAVGLAGTGAAGAASASTAGTAAAAAAARAGHCTRTVTGTHHGALVAGHGVLCLDHATQAGPVRVWPGAGLNVTASVISGAVTATRARFVSVCGSMVIGPLRAGATAGPVTAGAAGASCRGDTVHGQLVITGSAGPVRLTGLRQQGPVVLSGNTGGMMLSAGSVGGTVTVRGNRGHAPVLISADAVSGSLRCAANRPAPTDRHRPDTVTGTATGQCAALVPPPPRRQALPPLAQDLSSTLPNLNYGQAVGDFTGVGHDQLAYVQDGQLDITNTDKYGGGQARPPTSTDLKATPNDGFAGCNFDVCYSEPVWQDSTYSANGATYGMTSVKVAASASNIYMAGATWNGQGGDDYQLHLYKLPHDGSCASSGCAQATASLPSLFRDANGDRTIVATSLATGVVGRQTLIAVGLSDFGLYIFRDDGSSLVPIDNIEDMAAHGGPNDGFQTPVTALAFGPPSGPDQGGTLVGGVESPYQTMFTWQLNSDGTEQSMADAGGPWLNLPTMAAAVAKVNGQTVSVFTRADGTVFVLNPDTGSEITRVQVGAEPTGLTPLTPWNGDPDNQELVVGMLNGTGEVLQDQNGNWAAVPIGPGGATTGTADQVYAWWPGYGLGVLQVANTSAGPVNIAMASRPDPGYGCWLDIGLTQPPVPAFPASDTPVAAGATSPGYLVAALTAGATGDCASAQPGSTGERATYVVITPAGDAADEHIVKLVAGAGGTLRIDSQAGGYLTASVSKLPQPGGLWGTWQLTVSGGSTPAASAAPAVKGYRLTAAPDPATYEPPASPARDDPCRPVYRFDVTAAQWKNVAAAGQQTAQIPAMTAQGSSDGGQTWTGLGQLMPATAPALAADGTVTLGPASFFFQNKPGTATVPGVWTAGQPSQCPATGDQPVTEVRVVSGGLASAPVMLAGLAAPPLDSANATPVSGIQATTDGQSAVPRADGVDQAGLTLKLTPSGGGSVDPGDPRYSLAYYRDDITKALVTGLYQPGGYAGYTAVGRYAADGSAGQPTRNWLVTTSTAPQQLDAVMNDTGTVTANSSGPFTIAATSNPLTPAGASMTGGIGISGCAASPTGTCTLAVPAATAPALYQAGPDQNGDPVTGLQLAATAVTGRASLPLQTGTAQVHNLGSAPLAVTASQAKLTGTSQFFPADTADTALVTSGQLVPVPSIPVGG